MGNTPSTTRNSSSASSQVPGQHDSPRPVRRDNRNPLPFHSQRVAAPPEPSLTQAQGTVQPTNTRPKSMPPRSGPSHGHSPSPSMTAPSSVSSSRPLDVRPGRPDASSHEPAKPVAVPNHANNHGNSASSPRSPGVDSYDTTPVPINSLQDVTYLTRPPRLPLPIDEEVHTPGSPIIAPTDVGEPLDEVEGLDANGLPRPPSNLSNSSTLEDDEDIDGLLVDKNQPMVPTRLEWRRGGEKVYVTGTIFHWSRKRPLYPVEGHPGVFAATINIQPGTHHIRFLVDNQMQTSPDLPTTVDFGNNLVNYIEVNPDDALSNEPEVTDGSNEKKGETASEAKTAQEEAKENSKAKYREVPPPSVFAHKIPQYLLDFDQPEDSPQYHSALSAIDRLSNPPALPGFLGKPILNTATLLKDDNSVLSMPNHTVLNHLATSSIKNNILAVSATTRYKSKYVTTIMYKPTSSD
ncbi:hypothetical protein QBC47DRAFT_368658 [Echria macrotheca]|uniref:Association with the SNF1 complex (ASC) domain-containing protein n=1 Tax=Echria macrotheca TaxID=438768 RepID=A0AAJ0BQ53_9PEZI|nr:hypothetical protein QBC47DRAFT_368658 [Echria macrotheca]